MTTKMQVTGGAIAAAAAVVIAPALTVAASLAVAAWRQGWPASRLRNFALLTAGCAVATMPWFGPLALPETYWEGLQAAMQGDLWRAVSDTLPLNLLAGEGLSWWWWNRYTNRHLSGATMLRGEQHLARQRRNKRRAASYRAEKVYTELTRGRYREKLVLGHLVEREEQLPPTGWAKLTARHPWHLEIPMEAANRHMAVIGSSGSGKTELLKRFTAAWTEAAWLRYGMGSGDRPLTIFVNAKGDRQAADDAGNWCDAMTELGLRSDRVLSWPYEGRLDMWAMEPRGLVESIHALAATKHQYYDVLQRALLHLVIEAPQGPPQSSVEFLERLDVDWLSRAWKDHPAETRHLEELTKSGGSFGADALLFAELFRSLGMDFDAGRRLADVDAIACTVPGTRSPVEAAAKAATLVQLLMDELSRSPRRVLFVLDEYSAVSETVSVINLVERIRSMGGSVVVGAQSWEGLAPDEQQRRRLVGAMGGGLLVMQTPLPGPLAEYAGTKRRLEAGRHLVGHEHGDEGTSRVQDAFLLNPQTVRELPVGHVGWIRQGAVSWGVVARMKGRKGGQPSRVVLNAPQRKLLPAGERVPIGLLTAGVDEQLRRLGVGGWSA